MKAIALSLLAISLLAQEKPADSSKKTVTPQSARLYWKAVALSNAAQEATRKAQEAAQAAGAALNADCDASWAPGPDGEPACVPKAPKESEKK